MRRESWLRADQDEIIEVDAVAATPDNITSLLRGSDEVGSLVEIKVKKHESSDTVNVILSRMSLAHVHHMQVYNELFEQLRSASKRYPEVADFVRRVGMKVKEIDFYHNQVEEELRGKIMSSTKQLHKALDLLREGEPSSGRGSRYLDSSQEMQRVISHLQSQLRNSEVAQNQLRAQLARAEQNKKMSSGNIESSAILNNTRSTADWNTFSRLEEIRSARKDHYILMENEIEELSLKLREAQNALEMMGSERDELVEREKYYKNQLNSLTRELDAKQQELSRMTNEVFRLHPFKDAMNDASLVKKQLNEAEGLLEKALKREASIEIEYHDISEKFGQAQRDARVRQSNLQDEISRLQSQLEESNIYTEKMNADLEAMTRKKEALEETMVLLEREVEKKHQMHVQVESDLGKHLNSAKEQIQVLHAKLKHAHDQLNDALASELRLKSMLDESHAMAEKLQQAQQQMEKEHMARIKSLEEQVSRAQEQLEEFQKREYETNERECKLMSKLGHLEEEFRSCQKSLRESELQTQESNSKKFEFQATIERQRVESATREEENSRRVHELKDEIRQQHARTLEAENKVQSLEAELLDLSLKLKAKANKVSELEEKLYELEKILLKGEEMSRRQRDDFILNTQARSWQLDALKRRVQVRLPALLLALTTMMQNFSEKEMQASAREQELLKTLEKSQTSLLRAESSNVHSELEGRQQVRRAPMTWLAQVTCAQTEMLKMKIRSLEEKLAACEKDNENLERIINLPAEELASQALERSFAVKRALGLKEVNSSRRGGGVEAVSPDAPKEGSLAANKREESVAADKSNPASSEGRLAQEYSTSESLGREDQGSGAGGGNGASKWSPNGLGKGSSSLSPLAQQVITALSANVYVPSSRQNASGKQFKQRTTTQVDMDENYLI
eukprot:768082-Hanusia_phi.AAC.5